MWGEFDMTRRKVIFWNDLNDSYIVSEEYNGDKAEMERFGLGACDHTWPEFMEAMSSVSNLADFLKVISYITASYHATVNGVPLPEQANTTSNHAVLRFTGISRRRGRYEQTHERANAEIGGSIRKGDW